MTHEFLHDTLRLSTPYLLGVIGLSAGAAALGLLMAHVRNFSAASRHLILSIALIAPPVAAMLAATGINSLFAPPAVAVAPAVEMAVATPAPAATEPVGQSESACVLFALWIAGAALFLAASARPWLRWMRIARRATPVDDPALLAAFGARRSPRLAVSELASEPMVVGFFRPVILLPVGYAAELEAPELASVFAHELEHVRRRDNFSAAIHELACGLFWFDPLHWIARQRLLDLRERACDEGVLDLGCEPDPYLSALVKSCHAAVESPAVACMSGFHVRERIDSIMSYASDRTQFVPASIVRFAAVAVAAIAVALFALTASSPVIAATVDAPEKPPTREYQLDALVHPTPEAGRFLIDVSVFTPAGERVMNSKIAAQAGKPVRVSTTHDGKTYTIDVTTAADGKGIATMEVLDGSKSVFRTTEPLAVTAQRAPPAGPPVWRPIEAAPLSLNLRDADIQDVVRAFARITGWEIGIDPTFKQRVTITANDEPWDVVLGRALAPHGLVLVRAGEKKLQIISNGRGVARRPAPEGYEYVGGDVKAPVVLRRVEPLYPAEARAARIAGIVIVEARIDETGTVKEVEILKNLPYGLGEAAADAVRQWQFAPATKNGKPVGVVFNLTVNFKVDADAQQ